MSERKKERRKNMKWILYVEITNENIHQFEQFTHSIWLIFEWRQLETRMIVKCKKKKQEKKQIETSKLEQCEHKKCEIWDSHFERLSQ